MTFETIKDGGEFVLSDEYHLGERETLKDL